MFFFSTMHANFNNFVCQFSNPALNKAKTVHVKSIRGLPKRLAEQLKFDFKSLIEWLIDHFL